MSEQGYNKASALERIGMIRAELSRLYSLVEDLPEVLSAKEGTDMDAFDCSRMADDLADQCKGIGLALGFGLVGVEVIKDDIPWDQPEYDEAKKNDLLEWAAKNGFPF